MPKAELKVGQAKETTIRERVIDDATDKKWWQGIPEFADCNERPAFWEFVEWLGENWTNHTLNIWRFDPAGKNNIGDYVTKIISGPLDPEALRQKIGGGKFKVYLKRGSSLIYNENIGLEGAEKKPSEVAAAPAASGDAINRLIDLIERRIANPNEDLTAKAMGNALDMQARGLETVFAKLVNQQPQNTLEQLLMQVRLMKELVPAPAPASGALGTVKELAEVISVVVGTMKSLGLGGAAAGDPWGALLSRAPELLDKVRETIREAKAPGGTVITTPATVVDGAALNPAAQPAPATPQLADAAVRLASGQSSVEITPELIEAKLVEMLTYQDPRTKEYQWTGEDAAAWVNISAPLMFQQIVVALKNPGMRQIMFTQRPILAQVAQHPRLREFIEEFLAFADGEKPEKGSAAPGPVAVSPTPQA